MLKVYIVLLIILATFGNSFCQMKELSVDRLLKFSEDNHRTEYKLPGNTAIRISKVFNRPSLESNSTENTFLADIGNRNQTQRLLNGSKYSLRGLNEESGNGFSGISNKFNKKRVLTRGDDEELNPLYPIWQPIAEVMAINFGVTIFSNYVLDNEFAKISFSSVRKNFEKGFVWDNDVFTTNFFAHPYHGSLYFGCARSSGFNYFESAPFSFGGSLMWELFMETDPPQTNDIINTTISGIFLGEVEYRLSSALIDESKQGFERVMMEICAGLVDIPRGFNRLCQGKSWRVTNKKAYELEPIAVNIYYGANWNNYGTKIGTGIANGVFGFGLIYGNPFEVKDRKPMDFFRFAGNINIGAGQPPIGNLEGYGVLTGKTSVEKGKASQLFGIFHHYDYFENQAYQIGAVSFGVGWLSKYNTSKNSLLVSAVHLDVMPLGGSKSVYVEMHNRNYSFSGGMNAKVETSLNYSWGSITAAYNLYWYHTYTGVYGNELYGIFRPKVVVNVIKNIGVGAQFLLAHKVGYYHDYPNLNARTAQTMLLLQYTFGRMSDYMK